MLNWHVSGDRNPRGRFAVWRSQRVGETDTGCTHQPLSIVLSLTLSAPPVFFFVLSAYIIAIPCQTTNWTRPSCLAVKKTRYPKMYYIVSHTFSSLYIIEIWMHYNKKLTLFIPLFNSFEEKYLHTIKSTFIHLLNKTSQIWHKHMRRIIYN